MDREVEIARFFHPTPAEVCVKVLKEAGIAFRLSDDFPTPAESAMCRGFNSTCIVLVPASRERHARDTLLEHAREETACGVDPEHPMVSWSDDDLASTVMESSTWDPYEVAVAAKLLEDRGVEVSRLRPSTCTRVARSREHRSPELTTCQEPLPGTRTANPWMTILGFVASTAGGLIGLIIASSYVFASDVLPNGQKRWVYDPKSRLVGSIMFMYAVVVMCLLVVWGMLSRVAGR